MAALLSARLQLQVGTEEMKLRRPSLFRSTRDSSLTLNREINEANVFNKAQKSVLHHHDVLIKPCESFNDSSLIFTRLFSLVLLRVQHRV